MKQWTGTEDSSHKGPVFQQNQETRKSKKMEPRKSNKMSKKVFKKEQRNDDEWDFVNDVQNTNQY